MKSPTRQVLEAIVLYNGEDTELLARLVQTLRPDRVSRKEGKAPRFDALLILLANDEALRHGLADYLKRLLHERRLSSSLLDADMPQGDLWYELRQRLIYKVLPYQPERNTIEYILVNVFYREGDGDWVAVLEEAKCVRFLELMGGDGLDRAAAGDHWIQELLFTAKALALRIAGRAFDSGVLRMVPEYATFESPFVALEYELDEYLTGVRNGVISRDRTEPDHRQVLVLLRQCEELVQRAYRNSGKYGIGIRVNQSLMLMERMLERLKLVLLAVSVDGTVDTRLSTVRMVKALVKASSGSTRVLGFLDRSTQVIAREITQHSGRKGEHYITTTRSDYFKMLRTALGGGLVVAFACITKAWFGTLDTSLFGHAFLYSLNYAWAFITIYLLHWTLATKQPAMTAATLAAALGASKDKPIDERYDVLVDLMSRVWRSQFIAFVGNVFMAFPVGIALAYGWNSLFGSAMLAHKAPKLIHELDPFFSLAMLHASFAGIFLFISGLIAGSATNRALYRRIPQRIEEHPVLKLTVSENMRKRIAGYYERNYGGIISNLWFGIFMGSLGTVGIIIGLPLDIRHITFAAGNLALGLVGSEWHISTYALVASIAGIGLIGFINFIVSFTLSLGLAMRSRGIPYLELIPISSAVWRHFCMAPWSYYLPPGEQPEAVPKDRVGTADIPPTQKVTSG
jgi:site-specific recombinase